MRPWSSHHGFLSTTTTRLMAGQSLVPGFFRRVRKPPNLTIPPILSHPAAGCSEGSHILAVFASNRAGRVTAPMDTHTRPIEFCLVFGKLTAVDIRRRWNTKTPHSCMSTCTPQRSPPQYATPCAAQRQLQVLRTNGEVDEGLRLSQISQPYHICRSARFVETWDSVVLMIR